MAENRHPCRGLPNLYRGLGLDDALPMNACLSRLGALAIGTVVFACALPSVAAATDYCVGQNTSCAPVNHRDKLQNALTDAGATPEADRILLGAETYTAGTVAGYVYNAPTSPVELVGAGVGKTTLTGQAGVNTILTLTGGTGSVVSDLTIHSPANAPFGFMGLYTSNTARRIAVTQDATQTNGWRTGVWLEHGGTLEESTVDVASVGGESNGAFLDDGHIRNSTLSGRATGVTSNSGTIDGSRLSGGDAGLYAYAGATSISSSWVYAAEGDGLRAYSYTLVPKSSIEADDITLVSGSPGTAGAYASTNPAPGVGAEIKLRNSVMRGFSRALVAEAAGSGQARVTASYSDYDPIGNDSQGPSAFVSEFNVSDVGDAGFVDAAAGDYHLLPGSPLIDAGDPATAQGLDLDGDPLVTDGNGDGTARRDIGAFESPAVPFAGEPDGHGADTTAPLISNFRATPALFVIGRASTPRAARTHHGTRFRYTLSEQARVSLKIQRRLRGRPARYRKVATLTRSGRAGVNLTRFTGRIGKRALRPGRYRARITAIDAAGNRSASRAARFRIAR